MERYGRPLFIDDSGLFVNALNGFPGVFSAYVFKTIGCEGILRLMDGVKDRSARFECCIGFMSPGQNPFMVKGVAPGMISDRTSGNGGFGYDPIFVPEGRSETYAEIEISEKNKISHRGRAIEAFIRELPKLL